MQIVTKHLASQRHVGPLLAQRDAMLHRRHAKTNVKEPCMVLTPTSRPLGRHATVKALLGLELLHAWDRLLRYCLSLIHI